MWYKKAVIVGACVVCTLEVHLKMVNHAVRVHSGTQKVMHQVGYVQLASTAVAQERNAGTSPPKKSERTAEEKKSEKTQKTTPAQPKKKSAPAKDFMPTEKIRTDNAVDFPVDI
jgi:hypothetical protein